MSIISSYVLPHSQVLIPEIGQGKEKNAQATIDAIKNAANRIAAEEPETIIIITSHSNSYVDYFHISPGEKASGDFNDYGVEDIKIEIEYDCELVNTITEICNEKGISAGTEGDEVAALDHGITVPLYYLQPELKKPCKFVRISVSGFSLFKHYEFGKCIQEACNKLGRKTVVIASGDSSHRLKEDGPFGFSKEAATFDSVFSTALDKANFIGFFAFENDEVENAIECVLRASTIMAGALNGKDVEADLLCHESPYGVGMCVSCFKVTNPEADSINEVREFDKALIEKIKEKLDNEEITDPYVKLAKKAVETYVLDGKVISAEEVKDEFPSEMFEKRNGVFVTIKIGKLTRGCMGTFSATKPDIATEIIANAVDACVNDPRFIPIELEELDSLTYCIDLLGDFEHITNLKQINPNKHGMFVSYGQKTGIMLPKAEKVNTPEQQLEIILEKSGINKDDKYNMYRFKTGRHEN